MSVKDDPLSFAYLRYCCNRILWVIDTSLSISSISSCTTDQFMRSIIFRSFYSSTTLSLNPEEHPVLNHAVIGFIVQPNQGNHLKGQLIGGSEAHMLAWSFTLGGLVEQRTPAGTCQNNSSLVIGVSALPLLPVQLWGKSITVRAAYNSTT